MYWITALFVTVQFLSHWDLVTSASPEHKFTDGDIAGAVIGSILCTLVATCCGFFAFYWCYIRKRDGKVDFEDATRPGYRIGMATHATKNLITEKETQTTRRLGGDKAAAMYTNSAFTIPDNEGLLNPDRQERKKAMNKSIDTERTHSHLPRNAKVQEGRSNITTQLRSTHKEYRRDRFCPRQAMDKVKVKLRGHDFTGLGFNICGNLRDGIYVQNVLQRGPAAESGLLEPGDRIMEVLVSFKNIVFEDALTILSYASPYDVTLSVKKHDDVSGSSYRTTSSLISRRSSSLQPRSNPAKSFDHMFFPLKRSQSIGDLDLISRDDSSPYDTYDSRRIAKDTPSTLRRKRAKTVPTAPPKSQHSPASSIRHVVTKPLQNGHREAWHSRESSVSKDFLRQETPKGISEETVTFSRVGSPKKKAPQPPAKQHYHTTLPQPRPFSSVSESSEDASTSPRNSDTHLDESRSFGDSSMVNEIFREMDHDRSVPETMVIRPRHPQNGREYQTFEMIWTEGSESETSSMHEKLTDNLSRHSSRHGGIVLPDHTYVRQTTRSFPTSDDHDSRYGRSPHIIQTSNGSRLILPVNMEPTPSISTPTSFNSDDESLPSHRDTSFRDPRRKKQPSEHTEQIQTTTFTRY